jgi:Spy/CpxP family protein refolding chaperone
MRSLAFTALLLTPFAAYAQQPAPVPTSERFATQRIGSDAGAIMQLLNELDAKNVKIKELEDQLTKRKTEDDDAAKKNPVVTAP